ncbi:MAG TPA: Lrp/AsnC ligand binding domain-containing protein, partial [Thermoanaerobaculia bacterium]
GPGRPGTVGFIAVVLVGIGIQSVARAKEVTMVSAVVMLVVEKSKINEVAEKLVEMPGITEVYSVAGQYDLVAIARVKDNEGIADAVTNNMLKLDGITKTETLIAFRVFSRYNLERMFSIGLEEPVR